MSYKEFLENIDTYVGKVMRFTFIMKSTGKTYRTERYVWDNKDFCESDASVLEVTNVEYVRDGQLDTSVKGIIGVR